MYSGNTTSSPGSTADKLLDAAQTLIQQRGYHGFSYEDVSQAVGIRKPSIHHHFPKKEDIGTQVILRYTERFKAALQEIDRELGTPPKRLEAYVALFCQTYGPARKLCPCGILGAESAALPQTVADAVRNFFTSNLTWLGSLLNTGRMQGAFKFEGSHETQALILLSALEGSMVVGRGLGSDHSVSRVGDALVTHLLV